MKYLGYIADADGILLWFPSQNRTFSVPKPYVFGSETVRFLAHSLLNKLSN